MNGGERLQKVTREMVDIMHGQRLLSVAEAAAVVNVTRKTVYQWAKATGRPRLETALAGGKRVTTLECIQRFLRQEEPSTPPETRIPTDYESAKQLMNSL
jgi:DNA-binding XRE family transcriptional regulator